MSTCISSHGEYDAHETDWLPADGIDRSEGGKAATDA